MEIPVVIIGTFFFIYLLYKFVLVFFKPLGERKSVTFPSKNVAQIRTYKIYLIANTFLPFVMFATVTWILFLDNPNHEMSFLLLCLTVIPMAAILCSNLFVATIDKSKRELQLENVFHLIFKAKPKKISGKLRFELLPRKYKMMHYFDLVAIDEKHTYFLAFYFHQPSGELAQSTLNTWWQTAVSNH